MLLEETRAFVGEEYVGILEQPIERLSIFLRIVQDSRTHPNLDVPCKRFHLRIAWSPYIKNVGAIKRHIAAQSSARDDVAHPQRADGRERKIVTVGLKSNGIAL